MSAILEFYFRFWTRPLCIFACHSALRYRISYKSEHPLQEYDVISIFQDGGRDRWILAPVSYVLGFYFRFRSGPFGRNLHIMTSYPFLKMATATAEYCDVHLPKNPMIKWVLTVILAIIVCLDLRSIFRHDLIFWFFRLARFSRTCRRYSNLVEIEWLRMFFNVVYINVSLCFCMA